VAVDNFVNKCVDKLLIIVGK